MLTKNKLHWFSTMIILALLSSCNAPQKKLAVEIYETSSGGKKMEKITPANQEDAPMITINPEETFQTITGIGGSFTESSASLLNRLSKSNRKKIIDAYFSDEGARYSLTRTHINSCDFSLSNYAYANVPDDMELEHFSIHEDTSDIIPMIKEAMEVSSEGFKIIASPWTAPPWMKDNQDWVGGKLLPKYYPTWSLYFSKYINAYKEQGIPIWGITVENEPLGNGNNWESMHFTAEEMTQFVQNHLGPHLEKSGHQDVVILGYDQNRDELKEWVDVMYADEASSKYFDGTAIHWYASTYEVFPEVLQYAHQKAPDKYLIETEGCIDAEVPKWRDDQWYWQKEATDWGWDWAAEEHKHLHPKYAPAFRYPRDIIGCLNNWVDGWVDWNMVLDKQGGPNWFENWCIAPIIVDPDQDEVYLTPLYYVMSHFSKFIRPGSIRIGLDVSTLNVQATAVQNPDQSIAVLLLNENENPVTFNLKLLDKIQTITIDGQAIQTIIVNN